MPVYHTREIKRTPFAKFRTVNSSVKPVALCALYKEFTDDHNHSASSNLHEAEIDERIKCLLDGEDTDVVVDLPHLNTVRKGQYDAFWIERLQVHNQTLQIHTHTHTHTHTHIHVQTLTHIHDTHQCNFHAHLCTHENVKPF